MSPPLPVPSKAALRALRGLILGTSCTLALITEDRRRRIDYALKILENGERVKGAKNYRAGGYQLASALALEDDVVSLDPNTFRLSPRPSPHSIGPPGLLLDADHSEQLREATQFAQGRLRERQNGAVAASLGNAHTERQSGETPQVTSNDQSPADTTPDPFAAMLAQAAPVDRKSPSSRKCRTSFWGVLESRPTEISDPFGPSVRFPVNDVSDTDRNGSSANASLRAIREYAFPSNVEIVAMTLKACHTKDPSEVAGAMRHMVWAYEAGADPKDRDEEWVAACALLCRTCKELGQPRDAAKILTLVLSRAVLTEETYLTFDPLSLITALLKQASVEDRKLSLEIMDTCVALFLPRFTKAPCENSQQVFEVGKALLEMEFELDRLVSVRGLYNRCLLAIGTECDWKFTDWFIENLHRRGGYKAAIRIFTSRYTNMTPSRSSVDRTGSVVVKCVEAAHNYVPHVVLQGLIKLAETSGCKLRSEWVMRLLMSSWNRDGALESAESLFNEIAGAGFDKLVFNPGGICRVMAEIALEAGDSTKADYYIAEGSALDPTFVQNPRLIGILARFDAKIGNWGGVESRFAEIDAIIGRLTTQESIQEADKARSDAFVPILKIYASDHSIRETEQFLKLYTGRLNVPLASYMVPLVAKHYSALKDFQSLTNWLLYCAGAALNVDAAFSNAIIASCRHSQMPFTELRSLFRELRQLNPDLVNKDLERVMVDSAVSDSKLGGQPAWRRIRSLRVFPHKRAIQGRCASEEEVRLAMKQLITCGRPTQALSLYKRALHLGMPLHELTLRLAVQAQLEFVKYGRNEGRCFREAWNLIFSAQARGQDVDLAANYIICKQLRVAACGGEAFGSGVFGPIRAAVQRCEDKGIKISDQVLNLAGLACLYSGNAQSALVFAQQAAKLGGGNQPCYNATNFRIFMLAYAELLSEEGLRETVNQVLESHYRADRIVRATLEHARRRIVSSTRGDPISGGRAFALDIVKEGIRKVVKARRRLREQREQFQGIALGIMRDAAKDGGYEVADLYSHEEVLMDFGEDIMEGSSSAPGIVGEHAEGENKGDMLLEELEDTARIFEAKGDEILVGSSGQHLAVSSDEALLGEGTKPQENSRASDAAENQVFAPSKPAMKKDYHEGKDIEPPADKGAVVGVKEYATLPPSKPHARYYSARGGGGDSVRPPFVRRDLYNDTRGIQEIVASS